MHNNNYASPQFLSPRPTLPPSSSSSHFSPHFSWYDWPSEAPTNVYHTETEQSHRYTSSISHLLPPAGEIQQHSFGNQQVRCLALWFIRS
jgi:hypothetical protein